MELETRYQTGYQLLSSCIQQVVCGGCYSSPAKVISGVQQGTVLGSLLFIIYINDIPSQISSTCHLYADDCILYRQIETHTDLITLQNDLLALELWERK